MMAFESSRKTGTQSEEQRMAQAWHFCLATPNELSHS